MQNAELPNVPEGSTVSENILVTYQKEGQTITKRGFYSSSFNTFSIPPRWKEFNGVLLPDGWGGDHIPPEKIIKWEPINELETITLYAIAPDLNKGKKPVYYLDNSYMRKDPQTQAMAGFVADNGIGICSTDPEKYLDTTKFKLILK